MKSKKVKGTKRQFTNAEMIEENIQATKRPRTSLDVKHIKYLNERQEQFAKSVKEREITLTIGLPGSGKTYLALHTALNLLGSQYKKIILVKSVTTLPNEEIGHLPGDIESKMQPFMISYTGNIKKLVGDKATDELFKSGTIEVLPLAYIRGLTIDDSIVLIDECQNIDYDTFKSIITRIGSNSKYIIMGDTEQVDRKDKSSSCLRKMYEIFKESEEVGCIEFIGGDCVRNPLIEKILEKLKEHNI